MLVSENAANLSRQSLPLLLYQRSDSSPSTEAPNRRQGVEEVDEKSGPLAARDGVARTYHYAQYEDGLRSGEVDAVYLAVPNHLHREYAERAARAGVHVLCEKPLADNEEDSHAMVQACAAAGVKLMVAYRMHLNESFLTAIEARSGRLGELRVFTSLFVEPIPAGDVKLRKGAGPMSKMR